MKLVRFWVILKNKKSRFSTTCVKKWFKQSLWKNCARSRHPQILQISNIMVKRQNFVLNPKLLISPTNAYLTIYRVSKWMYVWLWTQVFKEKFTSSVSGKFSMHPMLRSEDLGGNVKRTTKKGGLELFWKRPNFPETLKFF